MYYPSPIYMHYQLQVWYTIPNNWENFGGPQNVEIPVAIGPAKSKWYYNLAGAAQSFAHYRLNADDGTDKKGDVIFLLTQNITGSIWIKSTITTFKANGSAELVIADPIVFPDSPYNWRFINFVLNDSAT